MTSNVGTEYLAREFSIDYPNVRESVLNALRDRFRPEFLNRIDEIVLFHPLSMEHLKQIVEIQMALVRRRMADRNRFNGSYSTHWLARCSKVTSRTEIR
jgi:ATP-dependent Clp protease ATP-binding subunit ClpA